MDKRFGIIGWCVVVSLAAACRPGDVLNVPSPAGEISLSGVATPAGAEAVYAAAKTNVLSAIENDALLPSELLSDEFTVAGFESDGYIYTPIDARATSGPYEEGDDAWATLTQSRSSMLVAFPGLVAYEPVTGRSKIGEAYALIGYTELLLAENFCSGTVLDQVLPGGGIQYGTPLTTDSVFALAATHFDSAQANANGDATIQALGSVGLGRALLGRGQYAAAAAAVANVPANFVYNSVLQTTLGNSHFYGNLYALAANLSYEITFNVADSEGGNGLNYRSAHDPRLILDTSRTTPDGSTWYVPAKFLDNLADMPLATGVEASLISAEAALQASDPATWLNDLNALRTSGPSVSGVDTTWLPGTGGVAGLAPLTDPGVDSSRVSLMFRERAFWLFGTGSRLGDLRRLIRQYHRDAEHVFPTGAYIAGPGNAYQAYLPYPIATYGTDVNLTLPTAAGGYTITNPNYKGCLTPTTTA